MAYKRPIEELLRGQTRFGMLTVVGECHSNTKTRKVRAICDCGKESSPALSNLMSGCTQSCGCMARFVRRPLATSQPEYRLWCGIKARCYNPNARAYRSYGGRGILMCDRWKDSFWNFLEDMGHRPSPAHSVDRIDNDAGYSPGNCRWATQSQQMRNTRRQRLLEVGGESVCHAEIAERLGLSRQAVAYRIESGWSPEAAMTTPKFERRGRKRRT